MSLNNIQNKPNNLYQRKFDKSDVYEQLKSNTSKDVTNNNVSVDKYRLKSIVYHTSGLGVGLLSGYLLAKKLNKNKTLFVIAGGLIGISLGHLANKYFSSSENNVYSDDSLSETKKNIKDSLTSTVMNNPLFVNNKEVNKIWNTVLNSISDDESVVLSDFLNKIKPHWEIYSSMTPSEKKNFAITELKMTESDFIRANSIMEKMIATMLTGIYANK